MCELQQRVREISCALWHSRYGTSSIINSLSLSPLSLSLSLSLSLPPSPSLVLFVTSVGVGRWGGRTRPCHETYGACGGHGIHCHLTSTQMHSTPPCDTQTDTKQDTGTHSETDKDRPDSNPSIPCWNQARAPAPAGRMLRHLAS